MKNIKYSFRLLDGDEEIETILAKLEGQKRSNYIREALKFFISYGERIHSIDNNLKLILEMAEQGQFSIKQKKNPKENEDPLNETDKFLIDSLENLLDI